MTGPAEHPSPADSQAPAASHGPEPEANPEPEPVAEGDTVRSGPTGHPAVDAVVAKLAEQADRSPAEQVGGYEAAHRALQQTLASIDQS